MATGREGAAETDTGHHMMLASTPIRTGHDVIPTIPRLYGVCKIQVYRRSQHSKKSMHGPGHSRIFARSEKFSQQFHSQSQIEAKCEIN